jgi:hypothetical protein
MPTLGCTLVHFFGCFWGCVVVTRVVLSSISFSTAGSSIASSDYLQHWYFSITCEFLVEWGGVKAAAGIAFALQSAALSGGCGCLHGSPLWLMLQPAQELGMSAALPAWYQTITGYS